jgi:hypothetical protein
MNRWQFLFVALLCCVNSNNVVAQGNTNLFQSGSRSVAMANASIAHTDIWANFHNQANLAFVDAFTIGFHFENRFFMEQLATGSVATSIPTKKGSMFSNFSYFGYDLFNESKLGVGYTHRILPSLAASVQFDWYNIYQALELGNKGALTFEMGIAGEVGENVNYGIHFLNPTNRQIKRNEDYIIPSIASAGASYRLNKLVLSAEVQKDTEFGTDANLGFEYAINKYILIRMGLSSSYSKYAFGLGFDFNKTKAGFAFAHHEVLGYTPHFSLSYAFN